MRQAEAGFVVVYDGSYAGFLSAVFEIFRLHLEVASIVSGGAEAGDFFRQSVAVETAPGHAFRVDKALRERVGEDVSKLLCRAFLSGEPGIELLLYSYILAVFKPYRGFDARNPLSKEMAPLLKISRSVAREIDLYYGMVRFQKVDGELYAARILPKYDIVTLLGSYFRHRLPDQKWLIYDDIRHYGIFYDLHSVAEVEIPGFKLPEDGDVRTLEWVEYYRASFIKERRNPKLLRQNLPVRYWDALPERRAKARVGFGPPELKAKPRSDMLALTASRGEP